MFLPLRLSACKADFLIVCSGEGITLEMSALYQNLRTNLRRISYHIKFTDEYHTISNLLMNMIPYQTYGRI